MRKISGKWWFLVAVFLIYLFVGVVFGLAWKILFVFTGILLKILPVLGLVFILMVIMSRVNLKKFIQDGKKGWFFSVLGGILSTGPIYLWYPLLAEMKKKGFSNGKIACFLYNRAVKLPLLPLAVFYFGWKYVAVLTLMMVCASLIQGLIIEKLLKD